jgi:ribosomal protein S18 acetylase RimI-like enzyme
MKRANAAPKTRDVHPTTLTVLPASPERWPDLEKVFAARGCSVARGCWCMFYRRTGGQASWPIGGSRSKTNRAALKKLVQSQQPPGLIAYRDREPVGWVSLGPREDFARLQRSPVMKPVDDKPAWSIVCFVVPSEYRRQGVAHALLRAAIEHARKNGATLIEAYPVDKPGRSNDESMWFGAKTMYDRAGFREVARRKPTRPVMRRKLR